MPVTEPQPAERRKELKRQDVPLHAHGAPYKPLDYSCSGTYRFPDSARHHLLRQPLAPLHSPYLRPNARFVGEQESGRSRYDIRVELKTVDLALSIVTGFFQISGLTESHPIITTCFKGEIINNPLLRMSAEQPLHQYLFLTEDRLWGLFPKNDMDHWKKLTSLPRTATEAQVCERLGRIWRGQLDPHCVYMRWKEEFLVPDSRVKLLEGALFAGFYYVVLNTGGHSGDVASLPAGSMSGLYFHLQSDKFQLLLLRYVDDRGVAPTFSFA